MRPRPTRGQALKAEIEARTLRSRPRPNLKRPNRALYFTVKLKKNCRNTAQSLMLSAKVSK